MNFLKIKTVFGSTLINLNDVKLIYADKKSNGTKFVFNQESSVVATDSFETVLLGVCQPSIDVEVKAYDKR